MRIVYLLETVEEPWGGVQTVLRDAMSLQERGHQVLVVSRSGPPSWKRLAVPFLQDRDLSLQEVEPADLVVGTFWSTVPFAVWSKKGIPVHFCQGLERDPSLPQAVIRQIDQVYGLSETEKIVVSPHLAGLLKERYGSSSRVVLNAVDRKVMFPGPPRETSRPLRVGLFGPAQFPIKGIATGFGACVLAARAGLDLVLVRASHLPFLDAEFQAPFQVEAHYRVPFEEMGGLYRSLDVFLGTSNSENEGFYLPGLEALACGIPSILTDIPCVRSYGPGPFAFFVPPGDEKSMAAALLALADNRPLREALREEGLRATSSFSMETRLDLLERTFREILAGRGSPSRDFSRIGIS